MIRCSNFWKKNTKPGLEYINKQTKWRFRGSIMSTIKVEFENVGFWGEGKSGVPGEKLQEKAHTQCVNPRI